MPPPTSNDSDGLGVVAKAALALKVLGKAGSTGCTTSEVARRCGLSRPTVHRLLAALADEGFTDRDLQTKRWQLGPELYLLGMAAASRYDITEAAHEILTALAAETGESAYLSVLRGTETVCLAEVEGSFPLRSHVLYEGLRLPLGVASAGLAILSHLPPAEVDAYLAGVDLTQRWGRSHSRRAVRERIATTRTHGYALNPGLLVEGSWGIGAAVFDPSGAPRWALSLTGVQTRFGERRIPRLGRLALEAAHALSQRL